MMIETRSEEMNIEYVFINKVYAEQLYLLKE